MAHKHKIPDSLHPSRHTILESLLFAVSLICLNVRSKPEGYSMLP
jgi:hypothetical protein